MDEHEEFFAFCDSLDRADEEIERGDYTEYDKNTIQNLTEHVKSRGLARLAEERRNPATS